METVEIKEKSVELLKLTVANYRFNTSRGDVVIQMPGSLKPSELNGVKQMFGLIMDQAERWAK